MSYFHSDNLTIAPTIRQARLAVAAIFAINGMLLANWVARIPDVKLALDLNERVLGSALLFMGAGALVAQITAGWLIGRVGSRGITIGAALLFSLAAFLPGMAGTLPALMAALFCFGACNGGLDVAMNAQAALVEGAYKRPIMSSFHGLWSVGGLIGAAIGGFVVAQGVAVLPHLIVAGSVGFVLMLIAAQGLITDSGHTANEGPAFALPTRALIPLGIIAFAVLFSEGAVADWSAIYLRDTLNATPAIGAAGFALFSLLMAAGRLTGDWLTTRLGAVTLVRGGGLLVTVGILLIVSAPAPWLAIIGFGLIGAGVACTFPLILSTAAQTPGVAQGTAIAAMATSGYTGFLVGAPLIGLLADVLSLRIALALVGLLGLLTVFLARSMRQ